MFRKALFTFMGKREVLVKTKAAENSLGKVEFEAFRNDRGKKQLQFMFILSMSC